MEKILFIVEGKRTEKQLIQHWLFKHYLQESENILFVAYENCVYDLFREIKNDEYLDVFNLLKEKDVENTLANLSSHNISQTYLFFDLDPHDSKYEASKVKELLNIFSSETEHGLLLISYPMIEANRHYGNGLIFSTLTVNIDKCANYKNIVSESSGDKYTGNYKKLQKNDLNELFLEHLKKAGSLYEELLIKKQEKPQQDYIPNQAEIFESQLDLYIEEKNAVSVLGSLPMYLFNYYGNKIFEEMS